MTRGRRAPDGLGLPAPSALRRVAGSRTAYAAVSAAALPVWLRDLDWPPMWTDEHFALRYSESVERSTDDPNNPPGYWLLLHGWRRLTDDSSLASLRRLSVACSFATAWAWIPTARRTGAATGRPDLALGAWSLLVLGPHALLFGRFARPFPAASTMVAVALSAFDEHRRTGRVRYLAAGAAMHGLLCGTQYFAAGTLAAVDLVATAVVKPAALPRHAAALAVGSLAAQRVLSAAGQPAIVEDALHPSPLAPRRMASSAGLGIAYPVGSTLVGETVPPRAWPVVVPAATVWAGALVAGVTPAWRRGGAIESWAPLGAATVVAATFGLAQAAGVQNHRQQVPKMVLPFLGLFASSGATGLAILSRRSPRLGAAAAVVTAAGAALGTRHLLRRGETLYPSYSLPWDEVAEAVRAIAGPEDAVVTADGPLLYYLARGESSPTALPTTDLGGDTGAQDRALAAAQHPRVVVVRRATDAAENRQRLDAVEGALDRYDLERVVSVGRHDPALNRLRRLLAGRDPGERAVELRVYCRRPSSP